jgi:hypothetical protein
LPSIIVPRKTRKNVGRKPAAPALSELPASVTADQIEALLADPERLRALVESVEMPQCGKGCPVTRTCRCKGECVEESDEEDDPLAPPPLVAVRGRHRWGHRPKKVRRGELCKCCRGKCDHPVLLACEHYTQIPASLTRAQLGAILAFVRPDAYQDRRLPPAPARDDVLHAAQVAIMEKRHALGFALHHPQDSHRKANERLGIVLDALGIEADVEEANCSTACVVKDHSPQESPQQRTERERIQTLKKASPTYAARLAAKENQ